MRLSDRLLASLPEGVTPEQLIELEVSAAAQAVELTDDDVLVKAGLVKAGPPVLNADRKPTVMKIVAWMVHEGVNLNRQFFVSEDLQRIAPTLFTEPNFGVMDFNHSAARAFSEEPKVIGVWYKAQYLYDEAAKKYGILATGMMFSWLFPDHADTLLADQERLGKMRFSMMALPESVETGEDENGPFFIIHNPAFMTVSALDVPPADRHAVGVGSESVGADEDTLRQRLLVAALERPWQREVAPKTAAEITPVVANEGAAMDAEKIAELASEKTRLEAEVARLSNELNSANTELQTKVSEHETAMAEVKASVEALTTKVTEAEVARDSAIAERDAATGRIAELEQRVAELAEFKASVEAKEAEAQRETKLAARKEQLPKSYVEAFDKKPEERRKVLEEKWLKMEDAEFAAYVEDELGYKPGTTLSFYERSQREGILPTGGDSDSANGTDIGARVRKLLGRNS